MIKRGKYFFVAIVSLMVLQSCTGDAIYDQVYSFKNNTWTKQDTATFVVDVRDNLIHDYILTLRTTTEYLYSNLWIYVMVTSPDGTTSKIAEKIPLAYPDGSWIGKVSGALVESKYRFASKPFPMKGEYTFHICNATQQGAIKNIEDIGLRIE